MTAKTFVIGNFKGGVGKTKITTMLAFDNAVIKKRKTLVVDLDPQANASEVLARTGKISKIEKTISNGLSENDLSVCITPIVENLDLIACDTGFSRFSRYIIANFKTEIEQASVLKNLLEPLKKIYDTIYIDVPPTISDYSDNAMMAADYTIIAFQTSEESLDGVRKYINYQRFMIEKYNIDLQVAGIVCCMLKKDSQIDLAKMQEAKQLYNTAVLDTVITYQERLKGYSTDGIHLNTYRNGNYEQWDFKAHSVFIDILNEVDSNIELIVQEG